MTASSGGFDGRVVGSFGHQHLVKGPDGRLWQATRRGKRVDATVGDRVHCSLVHDTASIDAVQARSSLLFRSDAFRVKELAANVDQVVVVFAPQPPFNPHFVWRALLAASAASIRALAVLNKVDVEDGLPAALDFVRSLEALGTPALRLSVKTDPRAAREALLRPLAGRASLLIGQSGMGKSSVLNLLVPEAQARTQEHSVRLNIGRQTTTSSRWFDLDEPPGTAVVDSPGFQAFGLAHLSLRERAACMPDLAPLSAGCRFTNCRHLDEPGCAVSRASGTDDLSAARYRFWRELVQEEGK